MPDQSLSLVELLTRFARLEYNVLMTGHTGVGKTTVGLHVCERICSYQVKFFNAAIMDPQVELLGIPTPDLDFERQRERILRVLIDFGLKGTFRPLESETPTETYSRVTQLVDTAFDRPKSLQFLRPKFIDECDVFFVDEINRAEVQTLNGIMEAIQFATVMGDRLPRLKMTWATRNPDGDDMGYHVQRMDPALIQRFRTFVEVDAQPAVDILVACGPMREAVARNLIEWYTALQEGVKLHLPPRRLEYIGKAFEDGLPLEFAIPPLVDVTKLPLKNLETMLRSATKSTLVSKDDLSTPEKRAALIGRMNDGTAKGLSVTVQVQKILSHPTVKLHKLIEYVEVVEAMRLETRVGMWAAIGTRLLNQVPEPAKYDFSQFGAQEESARRLFRVAIRDGFYQDVKPTDI